jgi:hypothetical protein
MLDSGFGPRESYAEFATGMVAAFHGGIMKFRSTAFLAAILASACASIHAQVPAGSTGQCKDGTYSTAASKSGACSGHKGVKTWYSAAPTAGKAKPTAAVPPSMPARPAVAAAPAAAPASAPASKPAMTSMPMKAKSMPMQQAAGGGPGLVWLNTSSKVYHCMGGRDYGKTKQGAYMSESDAKAKGGRPDAGKPCSK